MVRIGRLKHFDRFADFFIDTRVLRAGFKAEIILALGDEMTKVYFKQQSKNFPREGV